MSTHDAHTSDSSRIATETFDLANSTLTVRHTPAGRFAEVDHVARGTEFAGPLDDATITALREVSA